MLNVADYGAKLLFDLAVAADKLALGQVMDPEEVRRTVGALRPDAVSGRWWLCASLHPRMFAAAHEEPLRHLGKVIVTPQGTRYLVLGQQVGAWQHRLMLQVAGRQVADFLEESLHAGFDLSLGSAAAEESLLVSDCRFVSVMLSGLHLKDVAKPGLCPNALRQEACRVAMTLLCPSEVTAEGLPVPQHVCVSIAASSELVDAAVGRPKRRSEGMARSSGRLPLK